MFEDHKTPQRCSKIALELFQVIKTLVVVVSTAPKGPFVLEGRPVVRRVVVATPSSLTKNWAAEIKKWLGDERVRVLVLAPGPQAAETANDFKHGSLWNVLIASYETLRKYTAQLKGSCDLLVCDEGHRWDALLQFFICFQGSEGKEEIACS